MAGDTAVGRDYRAVVERRNEWSLETVGGRSHWSGVRTGVVCRKVVECEMALYWNSGGMGCWEDAAAGEEVTGNAVARTPREAAGQRRG